MCGPRPNRAFSLAELVVVLVCLALLGAVLAGGYANVLGAAREESAFGRARLLNTARVNYRLIHGDAEARWTGCGDDKARFELLREAGLVEGEANEYLSSAGGYSLQLGDELRGRTRVVRDSAELAYR